jgi:hypothetical protein
MSSNEDRINPEINSFRQSVWNMNSTDNRCWRMSLLIILIIERRKQIKIIYMELSVN